MELLILLALLLAALTVLARRGDRSLRAVATICAALALAGLAWWRPGGDPVLEAAVPAPLDGGGFVSSDTCRSCHPGAYDAWHRSYHRTMTQRATPDAVLASFDDVRLENRGPATRLARRGDEFWADLPDPLWFIDPSPDKPPVPPRIEARVVMTTGSHHLQNYWVRRPKEGKLHRDSPDTGALVQVPWVWLIDEGRWVPVQDSFLGPARDEPDPPLVWNTACFGCHSVATQPRFDGHSFASRSAELGIACEACHGPGEEHVRVNRSPLHRYRQHLRGDDEGDPTIVNPARLDQHRSSAVCGQCHSFGEPPDAAGWQQTGTAFRAGDELPPSRAVFRYEDPPRDPLLLRYLENEPDAMRGRFWADGTMRVAGREYNGMIESPCFEQGDMTCLSCHAMHAYQEAADQLAAALPADESCLQCHEGFRSRVREHTHHDEESAGSRCANCHMPHTTYGLFVAMRSHRVDSPSAAVTAETGRPNACNLCHLDRTLEWTSRLLHDWYDQPRPKLDGEQRTVAASVRWALRGDAAQRAIVAWHMGWPAAQQASGREWLAPYLAVLLADPYLAVRRVAQRSIETLPGFAGFGFDYVAPQPEAAAKMREAFAIWQRTRARAPARGRPELLQDARGGVDEERVQRLLAVRDQRPLRIIE